MSNPSPVVVNFVVKGINDVLKAMKTISDTVNGTERTSTAAAKAGKSERVRIATEETQAKVRICAETAKMVEVSERAGTQAVTQSLRKRLEARKADLAAHMGLVKEREAAESRARTSDRAALTSHAKDREKIFSQSEANVRAVRERSATMAGAYAKKAADAEAQVARAFAQERKRIHLDMKRGEVGMSPAHDPKARLLVLNRAQGGSVDERRAAVERSRDLAAENKALVSAKKKGIANGELVDHFHVQREMTRQEDVESKRRLAIRENSAKMAGRYAAQQAREEILARKQAAAELERRREQFARTAVTGGGAAVRAATSITGRVAGMVGNLGGGFSIEGALQERLQLDRQTHELAVASRVPNDPTGVGADEVMKTVRASATRTGTDATALTAGLKAYTDRSGDYRGGAANLDFYAKAAKATGSSVQEVMQTAGIMAVQNQDLGKDALGAEALKKLTLSTIMQARQGSVDFDSMARVGAKITRTSGLYDGDQTDNQRKLLGLSQIGMRVTGKDPSEAATSLSNIQSDATKHAGAVKDLLGRDFLDDQGRIQGGPDKFLVDMMDAAMKRPGGMANLMNEGGAGGKGFFGKQAQKTFQALEMTYGPARDKATAEGKSKSEAHAFAMDAVRKDVNKTIATKYDEKDLDKDFAEVMKSSAEQFEGAVRELKMEISEKLLPSLTKLVPILVQLTPALAKVADLFGQFAQILANNPLLGLGAALSVAITREVATAGLRAALEKGVATSLGAAGGISVATAVVAITAATLAIDKMANDEDNRQKHNTEATIAATNALPLLRPGGIKTKEDLEQAKKVATDLQKSISDKEAAPGGSKLYYGAALFGAGLADTATLGTAGAGKQVREAHKDSVAIDQQQSQEQKLILAAFVKAIERATADMNKAGPKGGGALPTPEKSSLPISRR